MKDCTPGDTPIAKRDKFSFNQCYKNEFKVKKNGKGFLCIRCRKFYVCSSMYVVNDV